MISKSSFLPISPQNLFAFNSKTWGRQARPRAAKIRSQNLHQKMLPPVLETSPSSRQNWRKRATKKVCGNLFQRLFPNGDEHLKCVFEKKINIVPSCTVMLAFGSAHIVDKLSCAHHRSGGVGGGYQLPRSPRLQYPH